VDLQLSDEATYAYKSEITRRRIWTDIFKALTIPDFKVSRFA
jgi:hypothetical protein